MDKQLSVIGQQARPKRRRKADNPYRLTSIKTNTEDFRYYVTFIDSTGIEQCVELTKEQFDAFDSFEKDDLREMNEIERHIASYADRSDAIERGYHPGPEDVAIERVSKETELDMLRNAMLILTEVQQRRLEMYYFQKMTYQQISAVECCSINAIKKSIHSAEAGIKKYFENCNG